MSSLKKIDFPDSITTILTCSSWAFFQSAKLECFSYAGTHDFSSLNYFFSTVSNVYVSSSYPSDKFAGKPASKGTTTCGVSKEHLEEPNYGIIVRTQTIKCSTVLPKNNLPFHHYMFLLINS